MSGQGADSLRFLGSAAGRLVAKVATISSTDLSKAHATAPRKKSADVLVEPVAQEIDGSAAKAFARVSSTKSKKTVSKKSFANEMVSESDRTCSTPWVILRSVPIDATWDNLEAFLSGLTVRNYYVAPIGSFKLEDSPAVDIFVQFEKLDGASLALLRNGETISYKTVINDAEKRRNQSSKVAVSTDPLTPTEAILAERTLPPLARKGSISTLVKCLGENLSHVIRHPIAFLTQLQDLIGSELYAILVEKVMMYNDNLPLSMLASDDIRRLDTSEVHLSHLIQLPYVRVQQQIVSSEVVQIMQSLLVAVDTAITRFTNEMYVSMLEAKDLGSAEITRMSYNTSSFLRYLSKAKGIYSFLLDEINKLSKRFKLHS